MECSCIRQTDLPHTTALFADLIYHPDRVSGFYPFIASDSESYSQAAAQIDFPADRRAALINALRQQNGDSALLELLAKPGTVAVVTGQQVGLFSGPAYTVYKALTAAKLAEHLTARGIPAVPVFWLATEDHDFAEVNQAWVFTSAHRPVRLEAGASPDAHQPVGEVILKSLPIDELRAALRGLPFADEAAALVTESYQPGRTFGQAFSSMVRSLLSRYGLLHLDPMAPAIRELAAPAIRSAIEAAPELTRELLQRNRELAAAGYHAQVHVTEKTSLFFLLENGRRLTLQRKNGDYIGPGRKIPARELQDLAAHISPNALLRPVIQDCILPTVAYVGGPAELAYLAQSQVIYKKILGRQPVALHRAGFTILDAHSRKLINRYHLTLPDFFHNESVVRERIAATLVPPRIAAAMEGTLQKTSCDVRNLVTELTGFDATLAKAMAKSERKIAYQLNKMRDKVARQSLVRDERASMDAASLHGLIYPNQHLQERLYGIVPLLAKHGFGLIDQLSENVHLDCPDHRLLVV